MTDSPRAGIRFMMTAGPVEVSPRVLAALAQPTVYHYYPRFVEFFESATEKLAKVYGVGSGEDVLILQGEAVLGLETSVACTINPGEKVLVVENGPFGSSFGEYVRNAGGTPVYYRGENNAALDVQAVGAFIDANRDAAAITMVHCETPAGILNPVGPISRHAKRLGLLTIVDAVASLGGAEYSPTGWGIDISVSASQKCIGAPPSLTLLSMSPHAWERVQGKKQPVRNSYLSLLDWKDSWLSSRKFPFTPFTNDVYALNAALDEILTEGVERCVARHAEAGRMCREGLRGMGIALWPRNDDDCSPTVTAFKVPPGHTDAEVIERLVKEHGILISGGFGNLKGKVLRIGTMGYQARPDAVSSTIDALRAVLAD